MRKIKSNAFTLSETLITLTIVGIMAVLVIPGLIKDVNNKAMMSLLQGTITNLNSAIQTELARSGAIDIENTDIWNNTVDFFKRTLDVAAVCGEGNSSKCYAPENNYTTLNGNNASLTRSDNAVLLKNGVAIDLVKDWKDNSKDGIQTAISIDLNGPKEPNIYGVDRHLVCITLRTNTEGEDETYHVGDVGACLKESIKEEAKASLKSALNFCKSGSTEACYYIIELTGFDPNYVKNVEKGVYDE